jgi:hypothetical protein
MNYRFTRKLADGSAYHLGTAIYYSDCYRDGWRFEPSLAQRNAGRKRSRGTYPTMEKCLPRWLGYPNHCESVEIEGE